MGPSGLGKRAVVASVLEFALGAGGDREQLQSERLGGDEGGRLVAGLVVQRDRSVDLPCEVLEQAGEKAHLVAERQQGKYHRHAQELGQRRGLLMPG